MMFGISGEHLRLAMVCAVGFGMASLIWLWHPISGWIGSDASLGRQSIVDQGVEGDTKRNPAGSNRVVFTTNTREKDEDDEGSRVESNLSLAKLNDNDSSSTPFYQSLTAIDHGAVEELFAAANLINRCMELESADSTAIEVSRLVKSAFANSDVDAGALVRESGIERRADAIHRECLSFLGEEMYALALDGGLHSVIGDILEKGAKAGNPLLRFLYATVPPGELTFAISPLEAVKYDTLAREFTLANLQDAPHLAFMAFGLSFASGEFFTIRRPELADLYVSAASICGASGEIFQSIQRKQTALSRVSLNVTDPVANSSGRHYSQAQVLADTYCKGTVDPQ